MTNTLTIVTTYKKRLAIGIGGGCLVLFILYIYLLSASVLHVVARTDSHQQSQGLRSQVSELEAEFIAAQYDVSEHIAQLSGYQPVHKKTFIDRGTPSLVLNHSTEQP